MSVKVQRPKKAEPETGASIEERIRAASDRFYSEKSQDLERTINELLVTNYEKLITKTLGFVRDTWDGGYTLSNTGSGLVGDKFRQQIQASAQAALDSIDFSEITLTSQQVGVVKRAYRTELKYHLESAARLLAREDSIRIAREVLDLPDEENPDD
jgi:hypothetical protein